MNPSYVLIAVSNVHRATALRRAVGDASPIETIVVRDGDDALKEMARRGWPGLLLIDLSLPRVDGFAVIRKIRRQASERQTSVVAVAAHESLRAAARELAAPLGIAAILPLDADLDTVAAAVTAAVQSVQVAPREESPTHAPGSSAATTLDASGIVNRAAVDARRRSGLPVSIGYVKAEGEESLSFHFGTPQSGSGPGLGDTAAFRLLRQVAEATEPLVVPNVESHPVFAQLLLNGTLSIRGIAAVPIVTSQGSVRAAVAVIDAVPLALGAADLDALAALGREAGQDIDRVLSGAPVARAQAAQKSDNVNADELRALQQLAATDPLTGLANRRGGEKYIANEISRAKRERRPLSCILLDVDRFKQVNDTFGHQAGDQLLRDLSNLLRRTVRAYDILVRWGGEEFLLVLPGVDLDMARLLAERVRMAAETLDTHGIGAVTISAGVASFEPDYDFTATLRTADQRLYQAKAAGRNTVV